MELLLKHFEEIVQTEEDVEELKKIILELAIQGNIVPQNKNEKPALKQLENEEKLHEKVPEITENPFDLPSNWTWLHMRDIMNIGSSKRVRKADWRNSGIPFYRAREIVKLSKHGFVNNDLFISKDHYSQLKDAVGVPRKNDLMVTGVGTIGVTYVVKESDEFYYKDASVLCFSNIYNINPDFVKLFMHSNFAKSQITKDAMGTTVSTLTIKRAKNLVFPLPPFNEQNRIVNRVNQLFAICDQLHTQIELEKQSSDKFNTNLFSRIQDASSPYQKEDLAFAIEHMDDLCQTKEDVDLLRQSLLSLAVQGKLVEQDPNDEPTSVLLENIEGEKERLVAEGKIRKPKKLPEIMEEEKPYELPQGWEWIRLGTISNKIHYGYTASAKDTDTGTKLLRISDIQKNKVNWNTVPYCDIDDDNYKKNSLQERDILIARTGGTIGKSFLIENILYPSVFASYLIRVQLNKTLNEKFFKYFLESSLYWNQLKSSSKGTGQPNVNATSLSKLITPLPPLKEQARIVNKIEQIFDKCDALEHNIELKSNYVVKFRNSVLNGLTDNKKLHEDY
ncbi:restriction endonuclease subunit S [Lentibacillus salinarum]|uniref:Restriction endonuclease subunit S n=1 Tax=Lentibacillus salinarum TaxID=446820 RepID=A0ABW3ZU32_9BACI